VPLLARGEFEGWYVPGLRACFFQTAPPDLEQVLERAAIEQLLDLPQGLPLRLEEPDCD